MPLSEADALAQAIADRDARWARNLADRQARMHEKVADRAHRKDQNNKDRWLRAATSLLSALVAIGVAYLAFREALEKVNAPSQHYQIIGTETKGGHETIKIDTMSGDAWALKVGKETGHYEWIVVQRPEKNGKVTTSPGE